MVFLAKKGEFSISIIRNKGKKILDFFALREKNRRSTIIKVRMHSAATIPHSNKAKGRKREDCEEPITRNPYV